MPPHLARNRAKPPSGKPLKKPRRFFPGPLVTIVTMSFCLSGYCCDDTCGWDDPPPPPTPGPTDPPSEASGIKLIPEEVHTMPGMEFTLRVLALDPSGNAVRLPSSSIVSGHNSLSDITVESVTQGLLVKVPAGTPPETFTVSASVSDVAIAHAKIHLTTGGTSDHIKLPHISGVAPEAVILDAQGTECFRDLRVNIAGEGTLWENLKGACASSSEVAIFSVDHGMLFEPIPIVMSVDPPRTPPWTSSRDLLERSVLPALRGVPVNIRIAVDPAETSEAVTKSQVEVKDLASAIFLGARTGIRFELDAFAGLGTLDIGAPVWEFDKADCGDPDAMLELGVDLSQKGLFVVYVQHIKDDWKGWACTRMPADGEEASVVVVSWSSRSPTTAAHELGHAFGLNAPLPKFGHTGKHAPIHGFSYRNVMWVGEDIDKPFARTHFSLGQAFRMNLDEKSWLVKEFDLPDPKKCQCNPYSAEECPFLYLDLVDIPLPPGPNMVCKPDPWDPHP